MSNKLARFLAICALVVALAISSIPAMAQSFTTFVVPGAAATLPLSINPAGEITGWYYDGSAFHGFVRAGSGAITKFDPPGSRVTFVSSINPAGAVTGY